MAGIFNVGALRIARNALDGLARRQEAVGSNIANIDTPGYRRKAVDFERALQERIAKPNATTLDRTDPRHVTAPTARGGGLGGPDGSRDAVSERNDANSVSIDEEMTLMAETQIRYQALTQSMSQRLSTLRSVIRG